MSEQHMPHESHAQNGSMIIRLTPIQMFLAGLVGGILVLCTIGFFILLGMSITGNGGSAKKVAANPSPSVVTGGDEAPTAVQVRPVDEDADHIRGNKNADVTIVAYTDLECPFCKRFHGTMLEVMKKYGDKVNFVIRHFPLDQLHAQARTEALASECAAEQGKFWEFVDLVFEKTTSNDGLDLAKLPEYAKTAGVKNIDKFNKCLADKKYTEKVQADEQDAQSAGAQGTPYSVILGPNGETIPLNGALPLSAVEAALQPLLQ